MMGVPKLSTFAIAMVWVGFFAVVFASFITEFSTRYSTTIDTSDIDSFNKLAELKADAESIDEATDIKNPSGLLDVIGGYFSAAYNALKTAGNSVDTFYDLTNNALSSSSVNIPYLKELKEAIITTVILLIVVGVFISAIIKKDV